MQVVKRERAEALTRREVMVGELEGVIEGTSR